MSYNFNILGVSPILYFFNQKQELLQQKSPSNLEYIATHQCTLDALIESVETTVSPQQWNIKEAVETLIKFWMTNPDTIWYWKKRLADAGDDNLLVARIADLNSLRSTFESLLKESH